MHGLTAIQVAAAVFVGHWALNFVSSMGASWSRGKLIFRDLVALAIGVAVLVGGPSP